MTVRRRGVTVLVVLAAGCERRDPAAAEAATSSAMAPRASVAPPTPTSVAAAGREPGPSGTGGAPSSAPAASSAPPALAGGTSGRALGRPALAARSANPPLSRPESTPAGPAIGVVVSAGSSPPEPPASPRRGAIASGPAFEAWLETTGAYAAGAPGALVAVLRAKAQYHCNPEYPHKFTADAPPREVAFASPVARGMVVNGKSGTLRVPFSAVAAGSANVSGTLAFSVCSEDQCLVDKARLSVPIEVR